MRRAAHRRLPAASGRALRRVPATSGRALRRLHDDRSGQIVPLFLLGLVTFVLLVVMILNTGQEVVHRTEVQNAADAAAITQASWAARSLNLIAVNQVALTQSFSVSVVSAALAQVLSEAFAVMDDLLVQYAYVCAQSLGLGCPAAGAAAAALVTTVGTPLGLLASKGPMGAADDFRDLAIAMADMNEALARDFPAFSEGVAARLADENGVDPPLFHPGARSGRATPLPVEDGAPALELPPYGPDRLCAAAEEGTRSGGLFGGFDPHDPGTDYAPYPIARRNAAEQVALRTGLSALALQAPLARVYIRKYGVGTLHTRTDNALTRNLTSSWKLYCRTRVLPRNVPFVAVPNSALGVPGAPPIPQPVFPHVPLPHRGSPPWLPLFRVVERPPIPAQGLPAPRATRDALSVVAFTRRRTRAAVLPERFRRPDDATYAYAQAEVYSEGGTYDLFTHDWRARLVPAHRVEREPARVAAAAAAWPALQRKLQAVTAGERGVVNAH